LQSEIHLRPGHKMIYSRSFGENDDIPVWNGIQTVNGLFPKWEWDPVCRITTKSIDISLQYPILHSLDHFLLHTGIAKIEICHILPVGARRMDDIAVRILCVPTLIFYPGIVPGSVIGHPVHD